MPATRSGTKYAVGPEHYGRYARQNGVFIEFIGPNLQTQVYSTVRRDLGKTHG
jgi:hypothetical protein